MAWNRAVLAFWKSSFWRLRAALFLVGLWFPITGGNASAPEDLQARVSADVFYLAQLKLRGRAPGTHGSRLAQKYIEQRFAEYGLTPWGNEKAYELPFHAGKNIIGVLPGSDPVLRSEIVLISAHYDHLGAQGGQVSPGAADNASGVAALLEIARELSAERPKRSVAFAAFDWEERMLLGAFMFAARPDFTSARIAGVINVDILGRQFVDALPNTLFVAGTEGYPELRKLVQGFGANVGMRALPLGAELAGPCSDHVAFQSRGIPCLFFSSGIYSDYHAVTDTADKLNYPELGRSTKILVRAAQELANRQGAWKHTDKRFDLEEVRTVKTVLVDVKSALDGPSFKAKSFFQLFALKGLGPLERTAEDILAAGRYDQSAREKLAVELAAAFTRYLVAGGADGPQPVASDEQLLGAQFMELFYLRFQSNLLENYRDFVAQFVRYRPNLFRGMPGFERHLYDIGDEDIVVTENPSGLLTLNALGYDANAALEWKRSKWLIPGPSGEISAGTFVLNCEGTRDQLADYCLLKMREQTNAVDLAALAKVYRAVTGSPENQVDPIGTRLARGYFADENEWLLQCLASSSAGLATEAIKAFDTQYLKKHPAVQPIFYRLITDTNRWPELRVQAMRRVARALPADPEVREALRKVLGDSTPVSSGIHKSEYDLRRPFADRAVVRILEPIADKMRESTGSGKSVGQVAAELLKKITDKRTKK